MTKKDDQQEEWVKETSPKNQETKREKEKESEDISTIMKEK